jgi:hypothetical protein
LNIPAVRLSGYKPTYRAACIWNAGDSRTDSLCAMVQKCTLCHVVQQFLQLVIDRHFASAPLVFCESKLTSIQISCLGLGVFEIMQGKAMSVGLGSSVEIDFLYRKATHHASRLNASREHGPDSPRE